ncbi:helix-turn-helix domain-containing protein [Bradyrhizobium sp.]|uniref:helix-turn-helix domain-containing protein n=1 Tax=Bradyrhizobium sp. TaxID=376 RepID=UPI003C619ACB
MPAPGNSLFNVEEARRQLVDRPLLAASDIHRWTDIAVEECAGYTVEDLVSPARDHHVITLSLEDSPYVMQERCGKRFESPTRTGESIIMPAGYRVHFRGRFPAYIAMRLSPEKLDHANAELRRVGAPRIEIFNKFQAPDPMLQYIAQLFGQEMRQSFHPAQTLLVQSLATALAIHMLRRYSTAVGVEAKPGVTVNVAAIRRALAYINDQPARQIGLEELAAVSGLSRFHFGREFKRHVGMTPVEYVEHSRIARAKELIRRAELPLAQVALAIGFADQSHFTRRFRHHVGYTPAAFAREHARSRLPSA